MKDTHDEHKPGTTGITTLLMLLGAAAIGTSMLAPAHMDLVPWAPSGSPYIVAK